MKASALVRQSLSKEYVLSAENYKHCTINDYFPVYVLRAATTWRMWSATVVQQPPTATAPAFM